MIKSNKMIYEKPAFEMNEAYFDLILCLSTTEGYNPVTDEDFTNGWIEN